MTKLHLLLSIVASLAIACGGSSSGSTTSSGSGSTASSGGAADGHEEETGDEDAEGEFHLSETADARGEHATAIESTATAAAVRFFVVDPDAGAIQGVVIKLESSDGRTYYTDETDAEGYAEVLVNPGQRYDIEYLSLGRRTTSAHVDVPPGPRQDIRLTLRYHGRPRPPHTELAMPADAPPPEPEHLVLDGIVFETGSATIDPESNPRLDRVVEFMTHMTSVRIQISGHTDNVGDARRNLALSQQRADAVRAYLVAHGVDGGRVEAVGRGDTQPVAPNDTEEGRGRNRRIEAVEL